MPDVHQGIAMHTRVDPRVTCHAHYDIDRVSVSRFTTTTTTCRSVSMNVSLCVCARQRTVLYWTGRQSARSLSIVASASLEGMQQ